VKKREKFVDKVDKRTGCSVLIAVWQLQTLAMFLIK